MIRLQSALKLSCVSLALALIAACGREKDIDPPAELVDFTPGIKVQRLWSAGFGGDEHLRLGLRPATDGQRLYAAGHDGVVRALNPANGREIWGARTRLRLSAGPGVGGGLVAVGSSEGQIVALRAEDGEILWQADVAGEVLAAPAVTEQVVVVRTVDGKLRGLNSADGAELWVVDQNVPLLSLRGTAPPVISGETVVCGFDNGKVLAVNLLDGAVLWEATVVASRGRTELERLVDIDSAVQIVGNDVFVVSFQGRAAMLALESGQIWWARDISSEDGLAVGGDRIYISQSNGDVVALRRRDGAPQWEQTALHQRALTGPALDGSTLVVADYQGYVHWLDADDGRLLARMKADGSRVSNPPLVADGRVFVQTDGGRLSAFQRVGPAG